MKRCAKMMAQRPRNEDSSGRPHCLGYIAGDRYRNRRYTLGFDLALDQSHGLMTNGSSRGEQRGVGVFHRYHLLHDVLRDR